MGLPTRADVTSGPERGSSRFRLLLKIASGGMGTVYLGHQRGAAGFQRLVAIKKAHPHLSEDDNVARMLVTEARLASLVRHPNVVGVTDVDDANGELLLVMEYVEGASLSELIGSSRPMSLGVAMRIILDSCEGLEAIHRAEDEEGASLGLVHRDVSPQNVLVGVDGVARLADFGIARASASENTTGVLRGKPSYMSPEYAASAKATPTSDVFALGVVAWETLTQRRLYKGLNDVDAAERVRLGRVALPSSVRPGIPRELDQVILTALAGNPEERFPSARAFAAALVAIARKSSDWDDAADVDPRSQAPWVASRADVGAYVARTFEAKLAARREMLRRETPNDPRGHVAFVSIASPDETPRPITTTSAPKFELTAALASRRLSPSTMKRALLAARVPLIASGVVCMLMLVATTASLRGRGEAGSVTTLEPNRVSGQMTLSSEAVVTAATARAPTEPTAASPAAVVQVAAVAAPVVQARVVSASDAGVAPARPVVAAPPPTAEVVLPSAPATPKDAAPAVNVQPMLAPPASAPENPY